MKYVKCTAAGFALRLIFMLWGSVSMGFSESVPGNPFPFPPQKATVVDMSQDKVFRLKKFLFPLPGKLGPDYILKQALDDKLITVKKTGGKDAYEVAIPSIQNIAPELQRPGIPEAFCAARVTQTGKSILRYYEMTEFLYSTATKKFALMPQYVRNGGNLYATSGWIEFSPDLFFSHLSAYRSEGDGIAIYDANTQKVYQLQIPPELAFDSEYPSLFGYDSVHSIVEVKALKKHEYGTDVEMEVTGNHGYYKIELAP